MNFFIFIFLLQRISIQRKKRSKNGGAGKVRQAHQHVSRGTIISRCTLPDGRGGETDKVLLGPSATTRINERV